MKTILIADDHVHLRLLVTTTLDGPDYRIIEASDGDEAYRLALAEAPDLPVIMLTARAQNTDRSRAAALGVHSYLVKPFSPIELLERVEKILGESAGN